MRGGRLALIAGGGGEPDGARGEQQIARADEASGSYLANEATLGRDFEQSILEDFEDDLPMRWICRRDIEEG